MVPSCVLGARSKTTGVQLGTVHKLGVKQWSCETTVVILRFPIFIFLPLESMAAHSPQSKFEFAIPWALAPPTGQTWTCIHVYNFLPIHPIVTNRYYWNLWAKQFYDVIFRHDGFSAILVYQKPSMFQLSQMLSNHLETWHIWHSFGDLWPLGGALINEHVFLTPLSSHE